jgi:hypothetical protein
VRANARRLFSRRTQDRSRGQALVEFALVLPLLVTVLAGVIVLGMGVFYQQQLANAAREAARYAVVHSATSDCPTVSWLEPDVSLQPGSYYSCDPPPTWPYMTAYARSAVFGMSRSSVHIAACWSSYWTKDNLGNWAAHDAPPPSSTSSTPTYFRQCTIAGQDPRANVSALACPATTTLADDTGSDHASSTGINANQVTAYACYEWRPPLAGFLLIPQVVHLRAVVTQGLEYQQ